MFQFYFLDVTRGSFFDFTPNASACSIKIWVQKNNFTLWNLFELNTLKGTKGTWKVSTMLAHAWALSLLANISYLIRSLTKMPKSIELVWCRVVKKNTHASMLSISTLFSVICCSSICRLKTSIFLITEHKDIFSWI